MKSRTLVMIAVMGFLASLAIPVWLVAQGQVDEKEHGDYVTDIDPLVGIRRPITSQCGGYGAQCYSLHPCCPGFVCTPASTRAFCFPGSPPPTFSINTVPAPYAGAVKLAYSFTFKASNGILPLIWTETGTLPPGLVFANNGKLSGIPSQTGSFSITVRVQDSDGRNATQNFAIQIFLHGFKATGSMTTPRTSHTATLLNGGKVLIVGGYTDAGGRATAELFDPVIGSFTSTGGMESGRFQQTATLLTNGKVLAAGGGTATAERYIDPIRGSFSGTGDMEASRSFQTATLLSDGKVLVAGGSDVEGQPLATAELFDPSRGIFTPTKNMTAARYGHTATLLQNGKVLLTGGTGILGNSLSTAELFDPATGTFVRTSSMRVPPLCPQRNIAP